MSDVTLRVKKLRRAGIGAVVESDQTFILQPDGAPLRNSPDPHDLFEYEYSIGSLPDEPSPAQTERETANAVSVARDRALQHNQLAEDLTARTSAAIVKKLAKAGWLIELDKEEYVPSGGSCITVSGIANRMIPDGSAATFEIGISIACKVQS